MLSRQNSSRRQLISHPAGPWGWEERRAGAGLRWGGRGRGEGKGHHTACLLQSLLVSVHPGGNKCDWQSLVIAGWKMKLRTAVRDDGKSSKIFEQTWRQQKFETWPGNNLNLLGEWVEAGSGIALCSVQFKHCIKMGQPRGNVGTDIKSSSRGAVNALKDTFFYLHKCTVQASSRKFSWGMNLEVRNKN